MKFLFLRTLKKYSTLLLTGILFLNFACEDDDHDDHAHAHDEGHTDAEGFVLEDGSQTIVYRQFMGAVTINNLSVVVGNTKELRVHFLDDDGAEIEHDDDEHETEESELQVTVTSGAEFATVVVEEHDDTGSTTEEHHEMALEITGVSAGTTTFSLALMHGTHADYESTVDVTFTVE